MSEIKTVAMKRPLHPGQELLSKSQLSLEIRKPCGKLCVYFDTRIIGQVSWPCEMCGPVGMPLNSLEFSSETTTVRRAFRIGQAKSAIP